MALTDNLTSYYKLDEASGNAIDATGTLDLTEAGTVSSQSGKINTSRGAYSNTNYFWYSPTPWTWTGAEDLSISTWVYVSSLPGAEASIWIKGRSELSTWISYELGIDSSGKFYLKIDKGGSTIVTAKAASGVSTGAWYHVVTTYNASTAAMTVYVNNSSVATETWTGGTGIDASSWLSNIKASGSGSTYGGGYYDETGIWNRVLTAHEVSQLYNGGSGLPYPLSTGYSNLINGITASSVNGIAVASISKINGI